MKKSICLNMIVKNESLSIQRALSSLQSLLSYWVIVDTGSTDGTQNIIREFLKDIPGELHERPWRDFSTNRNEAIALAAGKGDYLLLMDADDVLEQGALPALHKDCYFCWRSSAGIDSRRPFLIKNSLEWQYEGIIHEALLLPEGRSYDTLEGMHIIRNAMNDGARERDPENFIKDAKLLEELLQKEPHNSRYRLYLAQSYQAAGLFQQAIEQYRIRATQEGDPEEVYWALYQIGVCQEQLGCDPCESYIRAHNYRRERIEALYSLAKFSRETGNPEAGFQAAELALQTPLTEDTQFIATWMYSYGLLLEYATCAIITGRHEQAHSAATHALGIPSLPFPIRMSFDKILQALKL